MTIYVYGCSSCGINGVWIRKVQAYALRNGTEAQVLNSKYSEEIRQDHAMKLMEAGFNVDTYEPIVVDGDKITRLRSW